MDTEPFPVPSPAVAVAGWMIWGVKQSFCRYVSSLPDGMCDISADIRLPGKGLYCFPMVSSEGEPPTVLRFAGHVVFHGHGGLLVVPIVNPGLELVGDIWNLTCADPSSGAARLTLATGTQRVDAEGEAALRLSMALSAEGATLFAGNYRPGEPLDDIAVHLRPGPGIVPAP